MHFRIFQHLCGESKVNMDHMDFLHSFTQAADKAMATSFPLASTCVIFVARVQETPQNFSRQGPKNRDKAAPTDIATTAGENSEDRRLQRL